MPESCLNNDSASITHSALVMDSTCNNGYCLIQFVIGELELTELLELGKARRVLGHQQVVRVC